MNGERCLACCQENCGYRKCECRCHGSTKNQFDDGITEKIIMVTNDMVLESEITNFTSYKYWQYGNEAHFKNLLVDYGPSKAFDILANQNYNLAEEYIKVSLALQNSRILVCTEDGSMTPLDEEAASVMERLSREVCCLEKVG